jgi:hypothetical protein
MICANASTGLDKKTAIGRRADHYPLLHTHAECSWHISATHSVHTPLWSTSSCRTTSPQDKSWSRPSRSVFPGYRAQTESKTSTYSPVIVCWNLSIALSQLISRNCLRRSFVALREAIALTRCWSLMSSCHHVIISYLQSPNSVPVSAGRNMLSFSRLPVWQRRFRLASIRPTGFPLVGCRDAYRLRATSWLLLAACPAGRYAVYVRI